MNNPFKAISISLIPNFKFKDILYIKSLIIRPWLHFNNKPQLQLKENLSKYLDQKYIQLFDNGRSALYFLLKAFDIKEDDEVIIQSLTCSVVSASILWTKATPVYIDVDKSYNIDPGKLISVINNKTKAIIVQHTFGTPANLDKIISICKKHKIILIEDCAHGLGASYKNKKLGSFGQASFYSFGRDKVISGIWGGAISTNDKNINDKIINLTKDLPQRSFLWTLKTLLYSPFINIILQTYSLLNIGKILHFILRKTKLLSDAIEHFEKKAQKPSTFYREISPQLCLIIIKQLNSIDSIIKHRQQIAYFYSQELSSSFNPDSSYLRYTLEINKPNELRKFSASKKIFLGDWYNTVISPKDINTDTFKYIDNSCQNAQSKTLKIINLPTNPNLSLLDARKVVNIIKQWK